MDDTESSVAGISPHTTRLFGAVTPEPDNTLDPTTRVTDPSNLDAPKRSPKMNHLTQREFARSALFASALRTASGWCEGSANVLDVRALALRCGTHERGRGVEPMPPEVIEGPPPRVGGLCAGGHHDRTLHAVTARRRCRRSIDRQ